MKENIELVVKCQMVFNIFVYICKQNEMKGRNEPVGSEIDKGKNKKS